MKKDFVTVIGILVWHFFSKGQMKDDTQYEQSAADRHDVILKSNFVGLDLI